MIHHSITTYWPDMYSLPVCGRFCGRFQTLIGQTSRRHTANVTWPGTHWFDPPSALKQTAKKAKPQKMKKQSLFEDICLSFHPLIIQYSHSDALEWMELELGWSLLTSKWKYFNWSQLDQLQNIRVIASLATGSPQLNYVSLTFPVKCFWNIWDCHVQLANHEASPNGY